MVVVVVELVAATAGEPTKREHTSAHLCVPKTGRQAGVRANGRAREGNF